MDTEITERVDKLETRVGAVEGELLDVRSALAQHTADSKTRTKEILDSVANIRSDYAKQGRELLGIVREIVAKSMDHAHEERSAKVDRPGKILEILKPAIVPIATAAAGALTMWAGLRWGG